MRYKVLTFLSWPDENKLNELASKGYRVVKATPNYVIMAVTPATNAIQ